MRWRLLSPGEPRVYALVFDIGDEPLEGLLRFAHEERIDAAGFTAIGAFSDAELGYFDWQKKDYERIRIDEQVEVLSLLGDIAVGPGREGKKVHAHVVLGRRDGTTRGGHLLSARVRPTLEVIATESAGFLRREHDPVTGLALIRLPR